MACLGRTDTDRLDCTSSRDLGSSQTAFLLTVYRLTRSEISEKCMGTENRAPPPIVESLSEEESVCMLHLERKKNGRGRGVKCWLTYKRAPIETMPIHPRPLRVVPFRKLGAIVSLGQSSRRLGCKQENATLEKKEEKKRVEGQGPDGEPRLSDIYPYTRGNTRTPQRSP